MRRHVLFAVLLLLGIGAMAQNLPKLTEEMQRQLKERTASDEQFRIIITMADQYDQMKMTKSTRGMSMEQRRAYVVKELQRFTKASQSDLMLTLADGKKAGIVKELKSFWIFNGVSCVTTREMIYALSERNDIAYIESDELRNMLPENNLRIKGSSNNGSTIQTMQTNRPATTTAWNVTQVHADQVWSQYNINGSGIVVAVIDTGVNYEHPDLADHMWDGGTDYPYHGYDFVNSDNNPMDDNGHGSHCAGTVAGNGTSGIQTGMAPGATIMALKVLSAAGSGSTDNITSAMQFAIDHGADAVSMSLGGHGLSNNATSLSASERAAMVNMLNAGVVALVAAGNEGEYYNNHHTQPSSLTGGASTTWYEVPWNVGNPGNCPSPWRHPDQTLDGGHTAVITIGASNRNDRKSTFSSFGPCTWKGTTGISANGYDDYEYKEGDATKIGLIKPDIIVPGSDITSCLYSYHHVKDPTSSDTTTSQTTNPYVAECGTSMATPGAAGITALVIQAYNAKNGVKPTPAKIDSILEVTALPVDFRDTKNNTTGAGRADAKAAVDAIYTTATKPGAFEVSDVNGGCVNLSWVASTSAVGGYAIWRDNVQVGTTTELTYTDKNPGTGKHTYYVRAIDNAGIQSVRSNADFCTVQPYAFADNANITWNDATQTATLGWVPTLSNTDANGDLRYIEVYDTYSAFTGRNFSTAYWGMCFNPEDLRPYQGMSIKSVKFAAYKTSLTGVVDDHLTLRIYRGTQYGNTTGAPVYSQDITLENPNDFTLYDIELTTPYALTDISEDLWITFSDFISSGYLGIAQEYPIAVGTYDGNSSNVLYMGSSHNHTTSNAAEDLCWSHLPDFGDAYNYALSFECHLERTTTYTDSYTIDYPDDTQDVTVSDISGNYTTQHTPTLASGENTYGITAKVSTGGNVINTSCPQDLTIVKVDNAQTVSNINIDQTKVYLVQPTGLLNATNITCNDVNRLIIKDGGQLITNSTDVKATAEKNIMGFNANDGGWNFIASPMTTIEIANAAHTNVITDDYGLFMFDQARELEWQNYKKNGTENHTDFTTLDNGKGYLYASGASFTALFKGTLANPATGAVPVTYTDANPADAMRGWNLIGNPFTCNAYLSGGFYAINGAGNPVAHCGNGTTVVPPCTGVMVRATEGQETIVFSKTPVATTNNGLLNITMGQQLMDRDGTSTTTVDNAIVSFNEGNELEKFYFGQSNANIYIPQGGKEYAISTSETQGELPVSFRANENGQYTLTVNPEGIEMNYLHLIDNKTGADIDLLVEPSYAFDATTTDYESRFKLVFSANGEDAPSIGSDTFAFVSNGNLIVNNEGEAALQVIDAMGRVLRSQSINGTTELGFNIVPGVYVLRLVNGNVVKVQKIVID